MLLFRWALRIACAIPLLPAFGGIFRNRRGRFPLCALTDVALNASDIWWRFINRAPKGGRVIRDRNARLKAMIHK